MDANLLEVCCDCIESVAAAAEGGAPRVELCSGLSDDGITPSLGLIRQAMLYPVKVNVLIRPRGGDFVYSEAEADCMIDDIHSAVAMGVNGVVIGALTPDGDVDVSLCRRMMDAAGRTEVTFHRAFDYARDPLKALEDIIGLGCRRLLTSGQAPDAEKGIPLITQLQQHAGDRLIIMPGCGVTPENAGHIVAETGVTEIHGSLRSPISEHNPRKVADPAKIRVVIQSINS